MSSRSTSSAGPDVLNRHGQELVALVAIAPDRRVIDLKELQGRHVVNPHRQRVGGKQGPELLFSLRRPLRAVPDLLLSAFALGDVAQNLGGTNDCAVLVTDG